jgi:multidrug efflux pump subunit AcrB
VTVLLALPYSIAGAFIALMITQQTLNMYSMIGILLLMGIVKKNSILLVEFANSYRLEKAGVTSMAAMLEAGSVRLRPILMTSFATIAGAIPSAIAQNEGAELTRPMAITVIGGVFVSTFLTLIVIPAFYAITDRFKRTFQAESEVRAAFAEVGE